MNLPYRIDLLVKLGEYILSEDPQWKLAKEKAGRENGWFIPEFIEHSVTTIAHLFLKKDILEKWTSGYELNYVNHTPKSVGIVMAGNIPLVGFHDLLCVFISGHKAIVKPSSKDDTLIRHLAAKLIGWDEETKDLIQFSEMLKKCYAYIATGSNNSAGYFEYYFKKYPHVIRRNRTSVAILTGHETGEELAKLADDVYMYFGLGCRNVTKIFVPQNYDFIPLLTAFRKYDYLADHHKYKNNYDYNLAIHLLNKKIYMCNASLLLVEEASPFSPISQLNYGYYADRDILVSNLKKDNSIQCIAGSDFVPFGETQHPAISDYPDGLDILQFLAKL